MRWGLALAALSVAMPLTVAPVAAKTTVIIGVPNWPTAQVTSHIIAGVLQQRYDAAVRLRPIGTVELFDAIDRGVIKLIAGVDRRDSWVLAVSAELLPEFFSRA